MKKQTLIIIILCLLVATVVALSVSGIIGSQGSLAGYTGFPVVSSPQPITSTAPGWDHSYPTYP